MRDEFHHIFPGIREYLTQFPVIEDELQQRMRTEAKKAGKEHWLVPAEVGLFLYLLTKITHSKKIYEIGSFLGYSGIWFAKALAVDGKVILTESNPDRFQQMKGFLSDCPHVSKMDLRYCDAQEDLSKDEESYDMILIDHDKPHYCDAFKVAKKKIRPGGVIVADNVLWRSRIVNPDYQNDPSTQGILDFNKMIMNDPDVESLIVPIGDGVSLSYPIQKAEG